MFCFYMCMYLLLLFFVRVFLYLLLYINIYFFVSRIVIVAYIYIYLSTTFSKTAKNRFIPKNRFFLIIGIKKGLIRPFTSLLLVHASSLGLHNEF